MADLAYNRLQQVDPDIFRGIYGRCVPSRLRPMVISKAQYDALLNSPNLSPDIRNELDLGFTYRGNHYFSAKNFCFDCQCPFIDTDASHVNHLSRTNPVNQYPYVGY